MTWAQKLRIENAALNEVLRALTDDELRVARQRIQSDDSAHLRAEAIRLIEQHLDARLLGRSVKE